MFNMTLRETYDLLKIQGCQLEIRFDYPLEGLLTISWVNKESKTFNRAFNRFELETTEVTKSILLYAKCLAEGKLK